MNQQGSESHSSEDISSTSQKGWDYVIILLVFALTGTTASIVAKYIMPFFGLEKELWYYVIYFLIITPIYFVFLRIYAFVFGKSAYFLYKEKKAISWIKGLFIKK